MSFNSKRLRKNTKRRPDRNNKRMLGERQNNLDKKEWLKKRKNKTML
jgi:hypothetical protein